MRTRDPIVGRQFIAGVLLSLLFGAVLPAAPAGHYVTSGAHLPIIRRQAKPNPPAPKNPTSGSISGKVQADGSPIGEVDVSVTPLRQLAASAGFSALMARTESQQTDDDGSFSVEGLAPGAYSISVAAPAYIVVSGLIDDDGKPIYYRPGDQVTIRMTKGGVITGKITDSQGQPAVQIPVQAVRLRDEKGRAARQTTKPFSNSEGAKTDDRGIYRLYGLEPGVYLVSAGGGEPFSATPYTNDSPVYHPSATPDLAAEVRVQAGHETAGVDISYSSIPGHSVSGHLSGQFATGGVVSVAAVLLTHLKSGMPQAEALSMSESHPFQISGVPDGEYLLTALSFSLGKDLTISPPRRIVVKGSDVTGVDLALGPITTISGKVVIQESKPDDSKTACKAGLPKRVEEIVVMPHSSEKSRAAEQIPMLLDLSESSPGYITSPDAKGEFSAQLPSGGSYHIETELLDADLFLSSVTLPPESAGKPPKDASGGIPVKNSEHIAGVIVTVAQGAATVAGRVTPPTPGATLPDKLRVYLAPVEKESSDNTLRYYDSLVRRDGSFEIKHIAPGRYYVMPRSISSQEWDEVNPRPIWWPASSRQKLRQDAEKANYVVELKSCQQMKVVTVPYGTPVAPAGGPIKPPGANRAP